MNVSRLTHHPMARTDLKLVPYIRILHSLQLTSAGRIHNKFNYDLWQRRSSDINSVDSYSSSQKTTIERFDELRDTKFSIRPTQIHCPFHSFALE